MLQNLAVDVGRQEHTGVVAAQPRGVVCVRSLVPYEKNSASRAMAPAVRTARGNSIMVPMRYANRTPVACITCLRRGLYVALDDGQFLHVADERHHDFELHLDALALQLARRFHHGTHLHAVDIGIGNSQAAAAMPEHGVGFAHVLHPAAHLAGRAPHVGRQLTDFLQRLRQEFVAAAGPADGW